MSFHEIRFPTNLSFHALGGPELRSEIVTLVNGFEERNALWAHSRRRYDAGMGLRSVDELAAILAFFEARRGQLHGFRWKDWADYKSCAPSAEPGDMDQLLGIGDGVRTEFRLVKAYQSGAESYLRPIRKPVAHSLHVSLERRAMVEPESWSLDAATGVVSFPDPVPEGVEVRAGFEFDVPVRFATDAIQVSLASFQAGEVPNIPVVEIRL